MSGIVTQAGMFGSGVDFLSNLTGYWDFQETTVSANRASRVDGKYFDPNGNVSVATGVSGNCLDLASNYLFQASSSYFNYTGAFSISCWVRLDTVGAIQFILARYGTEPSGNRQYAVRIQATGVPMIIIDSNGVNSILSAGASVLSTLTWYHLFFCYDPSNAMSVYVNGVLDGNLTVGVPSSSNPTSGATLTCGARDNTGINPFDGRLDEVAIWDAYRPELAAALYNGGAGKFYDNF